MSAPTPAEAAEKVDAMLRHADLLPGEVAAVKVLRDHARATAPRDQTGNTPNKRGEL